MVRSSAIRSTVIDSRMTTFASTVATTTTNTTDHPFVTIVRTFFYF